MMMDANRQPHPHRKNATMNNNAVVMELPEPPSSNRYWRCVGSRMYVSLEAQAYKQEVAAIAHEYELTPTANDVMWSLYLVWIRGSRRGDISNRVKIIEDALQGILYENDSSVWRVNIEMRYEKNNPRLLLVAVASASVDMPALTIEQFARKVIHDNNTDT